MSGILYDSPFPTHDDDGTETEWVIVGYNPTYLRYYEEDSEAMDWTNWQAISDGLDSEAEYIIGTSDDFALPTESESWAVCRVDEFPYSSDYHSSKVPFSWDTVALFVRKGTESFDHYEECEGALSDYPLLDEDSYCALEHKAWERYLEDFVISDTAKSAAQIIAAKTSALSGYYRPRFYARTYGGWMVWTEWGSEDEWAELIEEHSEEWISKAECSASYAHGFSGDYDSDSFVSVAAEWAERRSLRMAALDNYDRWQLRDSDPKVSDESLRFVLLHSSDRLLGLSEFGR